MKEESNQVNQRQNKEYDVKQASFEVKDLDTVGRRVKVVLSKFDVIDSDDEMIVKGAFAKSLQERGPEATSNRRIAFLRNHDWEHQIGKWITLEETNEGLIGIGELGRTTKATDAFLDYQDGILREHSIGFNRVFDKIELAQEGLKRYSILKEIQLYEGSGVTFGANSLTPTIDVSKGTHLTIIARINAEMDGVIKALKNGKGTDDRLYSLEMKLKVLKQKYNDIFSAYPVIAASQETDNSVSNQLDLERVKLEDSKKQLLIKLIKPNVC